MSFVIPGIATVPLNCPGGAKLFVGPSVAEPSSTGSPSTEAFHLIYLTQDPLLFNTVVFHIIAFSNTLYYLGKSWSLQSTDN